MPTNHPLVYILVLHWRGIDHTRACLASVHKLQYGNLKILLVDNGSSTSASGSGASDENDGSIASKGLANANQRLHAAALDGQLLQTEFPQIELLRLEENRGFSGGCNAGIAYSLERGADFVWVLNNDTVARPDALTLLVDVAIKEVRSAAFSAAVLDSVSQSQVDGDRTSVAISASDVDASGELSESNETIPGKGVLDFVRGKSLLKKTAESAPVECDWLAASNLLLRATAVADYNRKNGVFDERYFLYFEDTELCHRLTLDGWKCMLVPEARIHHVGGASTIDKIKHWRSYYHTRNRLLFFSESAPTTLKLFSLASIYLHVMRHRLSLPRKGEEGVKQLQAELLGVKDFERRRFGKCNELESIF